MSLADAKNKIPVNYFCKVDHDNSMYNFVAIN